MSSNPYHEQISLLASEIMLYPCHYIVKFNDNGSIESMEKVIDEPFRESYERDMQTLGRLIQLEREMISHEQNKLRELRAWEGSECDQMSFLRDYISGFYLCGP